MARACGIRVGSRRFEIVVLDGGPKKHRITAFKTGEFPQGGEDPLADAAATLKAAAKELAIPFDTTSIAIDTGLAAFRQVKLPFKDHDKIREVIKFEVESQLPQWDINEVVIDFVIQDETESETGLLVAGVQKADIQHALDVCERAGIEPLEVDLEATAMVTAALGADICHVDDAQVLVHVGEATTSVVIVDGGKVRSLRAIRVGAQHGETPHAEPEAPASDDVEKRNPAPPPAPPPVDDPDEVLRRLTHVSARLRRELGRTVSGARTVNTIDAIYVCGADLPELVGGSVLDVPIYELDVFEEDGGQPATGASPLVVAYGVALRQLGGPSIELSLRREELKFTGTLERIELPVAVAALLLATLAGMFFMFEKNQRDMRHRDLAGWHQSSLNFLVTDPQRGWSGALSQPHEDLDRYLKKLRRPNGEYDAEGDPDRDELQEMQLIDSKLALEVKRLESDLGTGGEITMPQSALDAVTRVLGVFEENKDALGRFSLRMIDAAYQPGRSNQPDQVRVTLNMSFFADTASQATKNLENLHTALRTKPWVVDVDPKGSKEFAQETGVSGVFVEGYTITTNLAEGP